MIRGLICLPNSSSQKSPTEDARTSPVLADAHLAAEGEVKVLLYMEPAVVAVQLQHRRVRANRVPALVGMVITVSGEHHVEAELAHQRRLGLRVLNQSPECSVDMCA